MTGPVTGAVCDRTPLRLPPYTQPPTTETAKRILDLKPKPTTTVYVGFKSQLSHYQKMQLSQVKYLNDMADAFQNRTKSTALRREILEKQRKRNYQSEYDRIRSHVENSATPALTKDRLNRGVAHLKTLGAKALDTIN